MTEESGIELKEINKEEKDEKELEKKEEKDKKELGEEEKEENVIEEKEDKEEKKENAIEEKEEKEEKEKNAIVEKEDKEEKQENAIEDKEEKEDKEIKVNEDAIELTKVWLMNALNAFDDKLNEQINEAKNDSNPTENPVGGKKKHRTSKIKYTDKYMKKMSKHRRRNSRKCRSKKFRGGQFGASQWAPALVGNNYQEQLQHVGKYNDFNINSDLANKFQGGRRGGSMGSVLAQAATPAALWAGQYLFPYGQRNKRDIYSRGRNRTRRFR